ncbi:unnamed protein product [Rotaria magnacalcarata]|uniref:Uncharacterized protein n=1 Tax=Rotaria magnacalcarata TaxID=392030 RepID=A0A814T5D0_9BILA|nr:unnamed protein product [Rotaria magnacalcarata]
MTENQIFTFKNDDLSILFNQLFEQQRNERDANKPVDQQITLIRDDAGDKVHENDEEQEQEQATSVVRNPNDKLSNYIAWLGMCKDGAITLEQFEKMVLQLSQESKK